ncbi:MAG: ornithine cyclodeaminase family protein [Desulfobacteraceae bacterium]|nr:ornithine cyclodeaminase family protein [Desulfobacteraceae bacterium]
MNSNTFLYLSRQDVETVGLPMSDIIDALESMFREKGEGRVEMPPKPGIHTRKDAFIHAMPAYIPKLEAAGMKWVSGYPDNQRKKLPYISGLLILNDPETGIPIAMMDATWITAQRTGAATAIAATYLARPDSSRVGIIACGVQGRSNLEALSCTFGIKKVKAFDIDPAVATTFADDMADLVNAEIEVVNAPRAAVVDMDIVVTSGPILKKPTPLIDADWLAEGAFASPVDFDSYWKGDALHQADKLATDDLSQMAYYRRAGYFKDTPQPFADLGEIVSGRKPGREADEERTICINLGIALEDMATAVIIYKKAREMGIGRELPL